MTNREFYKVPRYLEPFDKQNFFICLKRHGFTAAKIAEAIGVSPETIQRAIATGKIDSYYLEQMASIMHENPNYISGIEEGKHFTDHLRATLNAIQKGGNEQMTREEILDEAKKCVCGQREQDYGSPESNFQIIADLWNGYLGIHRQLDTPMSYADNHIAYTILSPITATDVAMMMALLKIARIRNGGGMRHEKSVYIWSYDRLSE